LALTSSPAGAVVGALAVAGALVEACVVVCAAVLAVLAAGAAALVAVLLLLPQPPANRTIAAVTPSERGCLKMISWVLGVGSIRCCSI
jgi:hypothetical protein